MTNDREPFEQARAAGLAKRHERRLAHAQGENRGVEVPADGVERTTYLEGDDLVFPDEAVEDVAKAIYEAPHDGLSRRGYDAAPRDIQDLYRAEARLALAAALPHLRAHQIEVQTRIGYELGRKETLKDLRVVTSGVSYFALAFGPLYHTREAAIDALEKLQGTS